MGGESSKESRDAGRTYSREPSWGGSGGQYDYFPPPAPSSLSGDYAGVSQPYYATSSPGYYPGYEPPMQPPPAPPQQEYGAPPSRPAARRTLDRRYSRISDNYNTLEQVTEDLARAGLESSNLIVGVDFTKSNEWTGKYSFRGRSLHHISDVPNPYEQAISIIGRTLSAFDEDNLIPCFGFGDASTHDQDVFSFYPEGRPCNGFPEALERYRELVPQLRLAGPTSFAPIIEMAMSIVEQSGGQYHVLVIIADGQVTRSVDTQHGQLSSQETKTVEAIVKASKLPLSIILVGVGDGPWDMMKEFDDNIPARSFDNFQFVNFTDIMSKNLPQPKKEAAFALAALMEIPVQYKATLELGILGQHSGESHGRIPLPPPVGDYNSYNSSKSFKSTSFQQSSSFSGYHSTSSAPSAPSPLSSSDDNQLCPICLTNPKDMAFGCGHQTCCDCGPSLQSCPICRTPIQTRIKLY